jgi:predicted TIM-barrel fold metal-dependent hydrolase
MTRAPSSTSRRAVTAPVPRAAPVINTTSPSSIPIIIPRQSRHTLGIESPDTADRIADVWLTRYVGLVCNPIGELSAFGLTYWKTVDSSVGAITWRILMPYAQGRVIHDADAHIMEWPTWLVDYADPDIRDELEPRTLDDGSGRPLDLEKVRTKHASAEYQADEDAEIMSRKNFAATGGFIAQDRPRALDLLGFSTQLIFNTFYNGRFAELERGNLEILYGAARAHNRGMLDFCSVDERLLAACYVPLADFDRSAALATETIAAGAAALLVPSACPVGHSPSHIGLDPLWAIASEASIPIVFHVGGGEPLIDKTYFQNGLPIPPDFHGGAENFRSVDYMAIPGPPMQTLATMIFDGVLERFPDLKIGVIEQGAIWLPSWMKQMESAFDAFGRHEERLRALSLRPSQYVTRQIWATPYPTEDVGWITEQIGPDICLFSSDYPHVEGGRKPIERFEASFGDVAEPTKDAFYCNNFVDLMGAAIP